MDTVPLVPGPSCIFGKNQAYRKKEKRVDIMVSFKKSFLILLCQLRVFINFFQ